tara:strand:+ start:145330 stop:146874 length:1545 start_codon:yes stop_codon:yes gene_type:complete
MNGLLAILAILISAFAILPEEKRLDLTLRISKKYLFFSSLPVLTILIVVYSPVILKTGLLEPVPWIWGFSEDLLVSLCLIFVLIFCGVKVAGSKLPSSSFGRWDRVSLQYLRSKKFHELGYVFDKYHVQLFKSVENDKWYVRAHNWLMPKSVIFSALEKPNAPFYKPAVDKIRRILARPFPHSCKEQELIRKSVSRLLKSRAFVDFLAETHPMVATKATLLRLNDSEEYISSFFTSLIAHPGSVLYRELRDNQNCSYTGEYYLDESNELLNFYLSDISNAQYVRIWKPIADYVIDYIKQQGEPDNFYNKPNEGFSESDARWDSPIYVGSLFFEVMVSRAIFQRIDHHMWLMYVDDFLEATLERIERSPDVDFEREFPTRFDYLVYQMFSCCEKWVGSAAHLDYNGVEQANIQHFPEYQAAKTFGGMLRRIIKSSKFRDHQKIYFLEIALRLMRALDQRKLQSYSCLVFNNCIRRHEFTSVDMEIIPELIRIHQQVDHVLMSKDSTFESELAKHS